MEAKEILFIFLSIAVFIYIIFFVYIALTIIRIVQSVKTILGRLENTAKDVSVYKEGAKLVFLNTVKKLIGMDDEVRQNGKEE